MIVFFYALSTWRRVQMILCIYVIATLSTECVPKKNTFCCEKVKKKTRNNTCSAAHQHYYKESPNTPNAPLKITQMQW